MRLISVFSGGPLLALMGLLLSLPAHAVDSDPDAESESSASTSVDVDFTATATQSTSTSGPGEAASDGTSESDSGKSRFGRGVLRGTTVSSSPQIYALELRLGPYFPNVDEGTTRTAQRDFFGSKDRLYVGAEFDWQVVRIPYLGTAGIGASIGYTSFSGTNKLANGEVNPGNQSISQESTLTIVPISAMAVVRVDEAARRWPVPFVPYAKLGLGYALWSVHDGVGISRTDSGEKGRGHSTGLQSAVGIMFLLDFLEPSAARFLDVESGINNSYLFLEWSSSSLGGGDSMDVGNSGWVTGITLEM